MCFKLLDSPSNSFKLYGTHAFVQFSEKEEDSTVPNKIKYKINECKKCDAKFHSRENLKHHINTRHPREMVCQICEMGFSQVVSIESHREVVHKKK